MGCDIMVTFSEVYYSKYFQLQSKQRCSFWHTTNNLFSKSDTKLDIFALILVVNCPLLNLVLFLSYYSRVTFWHPDGHEVLPAGISEITESWYSFSVPLLKTVFLFWSIRQVCRRYLYLHFRVNCHEGPEVHSCWAVGAVGCAGDEEGEKWLLFPGGWDRQVSQLGMKSLHRRGTSWQFGKVHALQRWASAAQTQHPGRCVCCVRGGAWCVLCVCRAGIGTPVTDTAPCYSPQRVGEV